MGREQKIIDFHINLVKLSQKDLLSSVIFFEEAICTMLLGHEFSLSDFNDLNTYEMLLMWNITYNRFKKQDVIDIREILAPFTDVDEEYYIKLFNKYANNDNLSFLKLDMISTMTSDLENNPNSMTSLLFAQAKPEVYKCFRECSRLKSIIRTGWIKRAVNESYCESDATHCMQMVALASAYFRLYKPRNLDYLKVLEMILIHEIGEVLAGDIPEGDECHKSKHDIEEIGVRNTFKDLNSSEYFINLWLEFENRETEEAKFVYYLDKLDPIIKAKYLDEELDRDDLFIDFYSYEEKRGTFNNTELKKVFDELKN